MKTEDEKPPVALLGLGILGSEVARSLLEAGYPLQIYNRTASRGDEFRKQGAQLSATAREAVARACIIISFLADDKASKSVWTGECGALAGVERGTVLIECSTLSPAWIQELNGLAEQAGCRLLDAPVTGSRTQAAKRELDFLVGGDTSALEKARPVLLNIGKSIHYFGPSGSGVLVKLINNFVCAVQTAAAGEALALLELTELDAGNVARFLAQGAAGSPTMKVAVDRMLERDYDPNFHLRLMGKDLTYVLAEGRRRGLQLLTGAAALDRFQTADASGLGNNDFCAVVEAIRQETSKQPSIHSASTAS